METGRSSPQDAQPSASDTLSDPPSTLPRPADDPASKNQDLTRSLTSEKLRDVTDAVLSFLSTANNETLGACAIGLCATTYLVLGGRRNSAACYVGGIE
jgi:hypothetical protein